MEFELYELAQSDTRKAVKVFTEMWMTVRHNGGKEKHQSHKYNINGLDSDNLNILSRILNIHAIFLTVCAFFVSVDIWTYDEKGGHINQTAVNLSGQATTIKYGKFYPSVLSSRNYHLLDQTKLFFLAEAGQEYCLSRQCICWRYKK